MVTEPKSLANITHEAIQLLYTNMGVVDTVRFLNQFTNGFGNYTEERQAIHENKSLNEIIQELSNRTPHKL